MDKKIYQQNSPYDSPWSKTQRIKMVLWEYVWLLLCSWTPKPANFWRLFWLRIFGAQLFGRPFVHQRARIQIPWNLTMHDRACLGDRSNAYSLDKIEIHEHATVAQEVYICTGTHDFTQPAKNLITSPVIIGAHAFIGARAFIMPGVTIGKHAIIGACSVVTKNVLAHTVVKGNPAK
ncbi:DapH/DapD/GlmU-related protein [Mucilaginibacter xinganensis]|nr:DapH/DapD/GlmU-related protein [Mucilaginibacter xinganensis]